MFVKAYDAIHTVRHNFPILKIINEACLINDAKVMLSVFHYRIEDWSGTKLYDMLLRKLLLIFGLSLCQYNVPRKWMLMVIRHMK